MMDDFYDFYGLDSMTWTRASDGAVLMDWNNWNHNRFHSMN